MCDQLMCGNFGNMSIRKGDGFYITATGSFLYNPGSLIYVPLHKKDKSVSKLASSEFRVHRDIYLKTDAQAVLHIHPPYAVAASLLLDKGKESKQSVYITTIDSEGKRAIPLIPIVFGEAGTQELATAVSDALTTTNVCIASGHGTFAASTSLEKAYILSILAEHSCEVLLLAGFIHPSLSLPSSV
jgi:L-fuculose-phosphate aldolase